MGTSYSFKISEPTVYICPYKTDVKIKTFFFESYLKSYFSLKKKKLWYDNCFELNYAPPHLLPLSLFPRVMKKKNASPSDLSFSKLKSPHCQILNIASNTKQF